MEHPELFVEIGAILVGLAVLSRIASRFSIPTIPLFLLAGLAFGEGGLLPLVTSERFISTGAEIGLILLLFMLGLEYSAHQLLETLRQRTRIGLLDLFLNLTPGVIAGLLLGFGALGCVALGGVTYVTSSGIGARLLFGRNVSAAVSTTVLSLLVIEDLVMAVYLPVIGVLATGEGGPVAFAGAALGVGAVVFLLLLAKRVSVGVSAAIFNRSDEALLLTILGITLLLAGAAEAAGISAAVVALLLGIMLSGPAAKAARSLLAPLRDLFAALFFAFVGLTADPSGIPPVLGVAVALAVAGGATKMATAWWGARDLAPGDRLRAGARLVPRGEFSLAIAGIAAVSGADARFEAVAVTYILLLAVAGPIVSSVVDRIETRRASPEQI